MNWQCYRFFLISDTLRELTEKIKKLYASPKRLKNHPEVKLFVAVVDVMRAIALNPEEDIYLLGNTLGKKNRSWRRAKEGLPPRYRLFFKFFSNDKEIFFVWLNNEKTLRKAGAKTDCYEVFKRMINKGLIPSDRIALLEQSEKDSEK